MKVKINLKKLKKWQNAMIFFEEASLYCVGFYQENALLREIGELAKVAIKNHYDEKRKELEDEKLTPEEKEYVLKKLNIEEESKFRENRSKIKLIDAKKKMDSLPENEQLEMIEYAKNNLAYYDYHPNHPNESKINHKKDNHLDNIIDNYLNNINNKFETNDNNNIDMNKFEKNDNIDIDFDKFEKNNNIEIIEK
jgi:hypothetical protein